MFLRWYKGAKYYTIARRSLANIAHAVCRECNLLSSEEIIDCGEEKMKVELMQGRKSDGEKWTRCASISCQKDLGMGPRWWVCNNVSCKKECRSFVHKSWGGRQGKDGAVVGEEAV
jgi:hypothetical protein